MRKETLVKGALTVLSASIITRLLGFIFRVYIADKLGAEGMGLYQLVTSLYMLVATFATSGISLAVSRMIAEQLAANKYGGTKVILKISISWSLFISFLVAIILFMFANPIGEYILRDPRTIYSIRSLAPSIPFMTAASCFKGYFYAMRKSLHPSNATVIEQIAKMVFIALLMGFYLQKGDAYTCAVVSMGMTVGEIVSCAYMIATFYADKSVKIQKETKRKKVFSEIIKISLPIQTSSTFNSALRLTESILIIEGLRAFTNGDSGAAIGAYGIIKGMVLPLLLFPTSLLQAVITVLIPELSGANAGGREKTIRRACSRTLQLTLIMGICIAAIFLIFPQEIAGFFYHDPDVGPMIKKLCLLCPLMYLEMVCVGILNAIGEQVASMRYNIIDGFMRLILICLFIPKGGVDAFLIIMMISNLFTSLLNLYHLLKVTCLPLCFSNWLFKPSMSAFVTALASVLLKDHLSNILPIWATVGILVIFMAIFYIILLFIFGCFGKAEIDFLKSCYKTKKKKHCN